MSTPRIRARIVRTILLKELREALRDRRTLFLMILLPIILYPLLMVIVVQVAAMQQAKLAEQTSVVGVIPPDDDGGDVDAHPFAERLEADPQITLKTLEAGDADAKPSALEVDAIVDLRRWPPGVEGEAVPVEIAYESVEESSRQARDRIAAELETLRQERVAERLARAGLDASILKPFQADEVDRSEERQRGGFLLGSILPILVIVTVLLGAFYPAIDLTAGEKERGSIQTLFTAPITTLEIVTGKYFAVLGIAILSGMANLLSMALIFSQGFLGGVGGGALGDVDFSMSASTLAVLFVIILAIALFFSAVLLTVAILARSFKEAQNYLSPVYLVCIIPAMIAQLPGFELSPQMAVVPAVNVILLMKEVLVNGVQVEALFLTLASTLIYTTLVLLLAARLFAQERVVLGDRGSFNILAKPSEIRAKDRPSVSEGFAVFGLLFLLLFYAGSAIQSRWHQVGLVITLWVLMLGPSLGFARYLKLDLRKTFHLEHAPPPRAALAAVLLGVGAWTLVLLLQDSLGLEPPRELEEALSGFFPTPSNFAEMALLLFVAGVSPAVCEEAFFRGFLFSSLRGRMAPWAVILITALLFGVMHMSIYRLFGTTLLGALMGLLVWKSGSILTSAIFHLLNNGVALLLSFHFSDEIPTWVFIVGAACTLTGMALLLSTRSPFAESDAGST